MIDQVSQQQMEGKERSGEEEIIHRVQFEAAHRCDDEHDEEKEKQRREAEKVIIQK